MGVSGERNESRYAAGVVRFYRLKQRRMRGDSLHPLESVQKKDELLSTFIMLITMSGLFCPFPGEAAFPRRSNHKSSTERLPNVGENAQTDLGTARVHPRCEAAEQEPHCSAALPQEEA